MKAGGQDLGIVYFDDQHRSDPVTALEIAVQDWSERMPATAYSYRRDEYLTVWTESRFDHQDLYRAFVSAEGKDRPVLCCLHQPGRTDGTRGRIQPRR
ncbi:hypothetical protein JW992_10270 [candidate division KSB1 bacterium]|nr:hypothetical protein [candidate division KSB1 bacterium]